MKSIFLTVIISCINLTANCQKLNTIGVDFGGYAVGTPKYSKDGNEYNPFMKSSSSIVGFYYERFLGKNAFSVKSGIYLNKQFNSIISFYIPIEFNGNLLGKRNDVGFFLGYTGGKNYNFIKDVVYGFRVPAPNTSSDIFISKNKYASPHIGLNAGLNFKKISITICGLFHFLIPEFVKYETTYIDDNHKITEYNTNKTIGISFRTGMCYRF